MKKVEIILASTSKYRAAQLKQINLDFKQESPLFDEESFKQMGLEPQELASLLSEKKAQSLSTRYPEAVIIGGDQLVSFEGRVLGKSHTKEKAFEQLSAMRGKSHELISAISLVYKGQIKTRLEVADICLRSDISDEQIKRYIDYDNPIDCAGSYKMESLGISLFSKVNCKDPSAIQGVPLMALSQMLAEFGIEVP